MISDQSPEDRVPRGRPAKSGSHGEQKAIPAGFDPLKYAPAEMRSSRSFALARRAAEAARVQAPEVFVESGPLCLVAVFRLPRPKSARKRASGEELAAKRPDLSKLTRAAEDALTGVWFSDDALIIEHRVKKRVCADGERPGVDLELHEFIGPRTEQQALLPEGSAAMKET